MPFLNKVKTKKVTTRRMTDKRKERMEIYNTQRWRTMRSNFLLMNPLCEECLKNGKTTPVDDIHHRVSFMSTDDIVTRRALAFDYNNLVALCDSCHAKEHNPRKH